MADYYPTNIDRDVAKAKLPNPSFPIRESIKANSLMFESSSGYEQRRKRGQSKLIYELTYNVLKYAEWKTLRDFFLEKTNVEPFIWRHPVDKQDILVRFDQDTWTSEYFSHTAHGEKLYKLQVKLIQVFA